MCRELVEDAGFGFFAWSVKLWYQVDKSHPPELRNVADVVRVSLSVMGWFFVSRVERYLRVATAVRANKKRR